MTVRQALALKSLAGARVVAGQAGLERDVQWAHVVDMPDPAPWVRQGQLLLTTGFAWPTHEREVVSLVRLLAGKGLAAVALAVPGYLKEFPAAARAQADRLGLPLIEIPFEVPFAQITEELHGIIVAQQYSLIERSEQIHRALTKTAAQGGSLGILARTLGELLDRSVTFEDPDGKLLAFYSKADAEDEVRRQTLEEKQSPPRLADALAAAGLDREIRASNGPIRIAAMPEVGLTARVVCPIRIGAELAGLVWIIEGENELSELDMRAAEHAALVAALNIAHQRELAMTEARLGYASFLSLLEAQDDDPQAIERARLLGFEPSGSHRIGICIIPEPLPLTRDGFLRRERIATRLAGLLKGTGAKPLVTTSLNRVIFLLPNRVDVEALWSGLSDPSVRIVLGRSHSGTDGARRSYQEALSLLTYPDGSHVCLFDEALVPRVLMGDTTAHDAFVDHIFGKLRKRRDAAVLETALRFLAKHGFSLKTTAQALKIHQNTLRYRLNKALDILHLDLNDPDARFQLQLAAKILDFSTKT
jgi:purine catabolism regulator